MATAAAVAPVLTSPTLANFCTSMAVSVPASRVVT
jgi:hypothetical protein